MHKTFDELQVGRCLEGSFPSSKGAQRMLFCCSSFCKTSHVSGQFIATNPPMSPQMVGLVRESYPTGGLHGDVRAMEDRMKELRRLVIRFWRRGVELVEPPPEETRRIKGPFLRVPWYGKFYC